MVPNAPEPAEMVVAPAPPSREEIQQIVDRAVAPDGWSYASRAADILGFAAIAVSLLTLVRVTGVRNALLRAKRLPALTKALPKRISLLSTSLTIVPTVPADLRSALALIRIDVQSIHGKLPRQHRSESRRVLNLIDECHRWRPGDSLDPFWDVHSQATALVAYVSSLTQDWKVGGSP